MTVLDVDYSYMLSLWTWQITDEENSRVNKRLDELIYTEMPNAAPIIEVPPVACRM